MVECFPFHYQKAMPTKCPECENKFSAQEALCEDWRDPEKAFGCPHCGIFFIKEEKPSSTPLLGVLFGVGMLLPSVNILFRQLKYGGDDIVTFHALTILVSGIAIVFLSKPHKLFAPLKRSSFKVQIKNDPSP